MKIHFYKYQGTGNDFVMIDNRDSQFPKHNTTLIKTMCDRRFGIGADGLLLLENYNNADFLMVYYNSDGNQSSMCGNGGRCIVNFAKKLNIIQNETNFAAVDGMHYATINSEGIVSLHMKNVENIKIEPDYVFLDTGSPHHVTMIDDIENIDVKAIGSKIRYSELYGQKGSNVNFVKQENPNTFSIRTYERGVEDETLSCGTGATAVAIAMKVTDKTVANKQQILVKGGELEVSFTPIEGRFRNIFLTGKAEFVFEGFFEI
jgi:diaminopimelate epimerase